MICKNLEQKLYRRSGTVIQLKITFCCCLVIAEIAWKLPYRNLFTMKKKWTLSIQDSSEYTIKKYSQNMFI